MSSRLTAASLILLLLAPGLHAQIAAAQGGPAKAAPDTASTAKAPAEQQGHSAAAKAAPARPAPAAKAKPVPRSDVAGKAAPAASTSGLIGMLNKVGGIATPKAVAMPMDPKLVVYPYDPNYTYPIRCSLGNFTHIELDPDETLIGVYYNKQLLWDKIISGTKRDVFFSPKQLIGADTPLTVITTKRRIEATLLSVAETDSWYQRVSWHVPGQEPWEDTDAMSALAAAGTGRVQKSSAATSSPAARDVPPAFFDQEADSAPVDPSTFDFNYTTKGDADFRPEIVFSDSRSTWFRFPQGVLLPAIFALDEEGQAQRVNFVPGKGWYVVQRVLKYGALLKRNEAEVRVEHTGNASCGFFGCKKPSNFREGQ